MITDGEEPKRKKGTPKPPDGGWGWWVVMASFMISISSDGVAYTFGLFFVYINNEFHESKSATSWITSIMVGMTYASGPVAGALVNKFGCRVTSIVGSFVAAFGFAISYYAQSVTYLYISIGLIGGLGLGLIYLPAIVAVTSYFDKRRAFATGIAVCGSGFGTTLFAPIIELLIRTFYWRLALVITGGILLSCLFWSCFFRPLVEDEDEEEEGEGEVQIDILEPGDDKPFITPASERLEFPPSTVERLEPKRHTLQAVLENSDSLDRDDVSKRQNSSNGKRSNQSQRSQYSVPSGLIVQRKDIFYSGSVLKIPDGTKGSINGSILEKPLKGDDEQGQKRCFRCIICPAEIKEAFISMTDVSILKDPVFLFFAISNFLTSIGYIVPYIYLVDLAIGNNPNLPLHSIQDASFLLSIIGATNTLSRVLVGYLSDKKWMNRLYLYNGALSLCGIATAMAPQVLNDLNALRFYSGVFGATVGVYVSLTSVILVDLLGIEKLTNAFGLLLLFQGVATVIGPPIVGVLSDHFKNHKYGFGLAGGMIAISGLMCFFIPLLQRKKLKWDNEDLNPRATEENLSMGNQSNVEING